MVERLFLAVPRGCLQFVIVVFPDHTHLLFLGLQLISKLWKHDSISPICYRISDLQDIVLFILDVNYHNICTILALR